MSASCNCKSATLRAYLSLRSIGRTDAVAFENAVAVYRYHHPEAPDERAGEIVSRWLEAERAQPGGYVN